MTGRPSIERTTAAYASNCSSSVGGSSAVEEQELGPVEPDPLGPAVQAGGCLGGELDVAPEPDRHPVERLGGQVGQAGQPLEPRGPLGGRLAVARQGRRVGVEHDQPLVAVDDHRPGVPGEVEEPADADHRGDLQRLGDDRRVAGPAAGLGGEAEDELGVEPGGLAGREVVRQQHARLREAARTTGVRRWPIRWPRIRCWMSRTSAARAAR